MQLLIVYLLLLVTIGCVGWYIFRKLRDMLTGRTHKKICHSCPLKETCLKECPDRKKTA